MDKKGLAVFLAVTFGLGVLLLSGGQALGLIVHESPTLFNSLVLLVVMWVPAVGALAASVVSPDSGHAVPRVLPLPPGPVLRLAVLVPLLFALSYALTWALGLASPQWHLSALLSQLDLSTVQLPPAALAALPQLLLASGLVLSVALGCTFFAAALLGLELGWRGYLLPRLMPLGRIPAHLITGLLWGLWFLPLTIGRLNYLETFDSLPVTLLCGGATALALNAFLNEVALRRRHLGLSAMALGLFVSQQEGVWWYLFPSAELPLSGDRGLLLAALFAVAAVFAGPLLGADRKKGPDTPAA